MSHAGWGEIWNLVLSRVAAEPVQFRILFGLVVAFAAVIFLEGLRASFLPNYRKAHAAQPFAPSPAAKASGSKTSTLAAKAETKSESKLGAYVPFQPREIAYNQKRSKVRINRHAAERPKIHRVPGAEPVTAFFEPEGEVFAAPPPMFTEDAQPFSPLPPADELIAV